MYYVKDNCDCQLLSKVDKVKEKRGFDKDDVDEEDRQVRVKGSWNSC